MERSPWQVLGLHSASLMAGLPSDGDASRRGASPGRRALGTGDFAAGQWRCEIAPADWDVVNFSRNLTGKIRLPGRSTRLGSGRRTRSRRHWPGPIAFTITPGPCGTSAKWRSRRHGREDVSRCSSSAAAGDASVARRQAFGTRDSLISPHVYDFAPASRPANTA